jgi:4-hydroxybenzoyl-CoA reductase subunit beta
MLRLPPYRYVRPRSLAEALDALHAEPGRAMPIAGGTDLVPNLKHRLFEPERLVSLRSIPELRGVGMADGHLRIGAMERLADVAARPEVRRHAPGLAEAAGLVAGPQLRNMGTVGGNVCLDTRCTYYNQSFFWRSALGFCLKKDGDTCHVTKVGRKCVAAHSADTPPVLMALDAEIELVGPTGERRVQAAEFFVADGIWNTVRRPDELVTAVRVPLAERRRSAYRKLRQRASIDFPLLSVAVAADLEDDGTVAALRVVVSALGARPRMLTGLDAIAAGQRFTDDVVQAVAERAEAQCRPLTNITVDPEWRRAMVPVQVRRALAGLNAPGGSGSPARAG